jgi:uncharacterized protein
MKFDLEQLTQKLHEELPLLQQKFSVKSLAVFGSVARRDPQPNDLDLIVEFCEMPGLFEFIALENHLSDMLGVKVDLLTLDSLKPRVSKNVVKEMVFV